MHGFDADENTRRVADKFSYKMHVALFDPNILHEAGYFDYVTMSQAIEHVTGLIQTLWINWHAPYHLQFSTSRSMEQPAEQTGLVLERSTTITPSAWLDYQSIHLFSRPPEGTPSKFWAPGGKWSFKQKVMLKGVSIVHRYKINHVATRLFDIVGAGDNRLYFLRKP